MWEAILCHITEDGPVRRDGILERFRNDDELAVTAVLVDLLN